MLPARVTVKVNGVTPLLPSLKGAFIAAIESIVNVAGVDDPMDRV